MRARDRPESVFFECRAASPPCWFLIHALFRDGGVSWARWRATLGCGQVVAGAPITWYITFGHLCEPTKFWTAGSCYCRVMEVNRGTAKRLFVFLLGLCGPFLHFMSLVPGVLPLLLNPDAGCSAPSLGLCTHPGGGRPRPTSTRFRHPPIVVAQVHQHQCARGKQRREGRPHDALDHGPTRHYLRPRSPVAERPRQQRGDHGAPRQRRQRRRHRDQPRFPRDSRAHGPHRRTPRGGQRHQPQLWHRPRRPTHLYSRPR